MIIIVWEEIFLVCTDETGRAGADNVTKTNVIINGEQPGDSGDPELSEEPHNVPTNHTNHVLAETFSLTKSPYLAAALAPGH